MLFAFAPAKSRTSGPKGHNDDNVYAGDKSPAYPKDEFSAACEAVPFVRLSSLALVSARASCTAQIQFAKVWGVGEEQDFRSITNH